MSRRLTIIQDLLRADARTRRAIIEAMHRKNVDYFRRSAPPALAKALERVGTGRFEIRITAGFLEILERGKPCHPDGNLLGYVRELGAWHHASWQDRLSVTHVYVGADEHSKLRTRFINSLYAAVPSLKKTGQVTLQKLADGRSYSGTTVFLGVHAGLHIAQYLNTTVVKDIVIVEPDVEYLALSCFFLDYEAIHKRFGRLVLHVGPKMPEDPVTFLITSASVTSAVWLRMLPAYKSDLFDEVVRRISIRWNAFHEIRVSCDVELANFRRGRENLEARKPVLAIRPKLSEASRIVVVGTGPSLANDLPWLKANADRLIIIAAYSAVRALKGAGIRSDFCATLDTAVPDDLLPKLDLDFETPLFAYYKADPAFLDRFREIYLFHEENKANVVNFTLKMGGTHPTTGNTAAALAYFFGPRTIYLAGMDLAFREAAKSHAPGTWHDDDALGHVEAQNNDALAVDEANFEGAPLFTHSYLNAARTGLESVFAQAKIDVVNLSDGVRLKGTRAGRSDEIRLATYPTKAQDIAAIKAAFSTDQGWQEYERSPEEARAGFTDRVMRRLEFPRFDWLDLARALDTAWAWGLMEDIALGDFRLEVYSKLCHDLLLDWYRVLCHTRTEAEAEAVYRAGLPQLRTILSELPF